MRYILRQNINMLWGLFACDFDVMVFYVVAIMIDEWCSGFGVCVRGYNQFCNRSDLEDDCLKIKCTIGVLVTVCPEPPKLKTIEVPKSDMGAQFGVLLDTGAFSDINFSVGGEKFHAHKLVLSARAKLFLAEVVTGVEKDEHGDIVVHDIEPKVFKVPHRLKMIAFSLSFCSNYYYLFFYCLVTFKCVLTSI